MWASGWSAAFVIWRSQVLALHPPLLTPRLRFVYSQMFSFLPVGNFIHSLIYKFNHVCWSWKALSGKWSIRYRLRIYILTTLSSKRKDIWFLFLIRYGDKTPKTFCGRSFGIIWILIGAITLSLFTALMTNAIQASLDGTRCRDIGGKKVSNPNMNT